MESIFGGTIEFDDDKDLEQFIENMKYEDSIRILEASLNYTIRSGLFDMKEGFIIYKCLSKLKNKNEAK